MPPTIGQLSWKAVEDPEHRCEAYSYLDERGPQKYSYRPHHLQEMGLAFDERDLEYYTAMFVEMGRDPTNVELFDIAQSNSEHSRHWFFGGDMIIDGKKMDKTLFQVWCGVVRCGAEEDGVEEEDSVEEDGQDTVPGVVWCVWGG